MTPQFISIIPHITECKKTPKTEKNKERIEQRNCKVSFKNIFHSTDLFGGIKLFLLYKQQKIE